MKVEIINYNLPRNLIAQRPAAERDRSRLMICRREGGEPSHAAFADFPNYLREGDVLVINDTSVYPARLRGSSDDAELLLLRKLAPGRYRALARPAHRAVVGRRFSFGEAGLNAEVVAVLTGPERVVEFYGAEDVEAAIDALGEVPLPPYIKRPVGPTAEDAERYQTVYARHRGSVAAPTAGLHFTRGLLGEIRAMGVDVVEITLHVSYGTFKPIRADAFEEHEMEREEMNVNRAAARTVSTAKLEGRRVVAVGTTAVRALETAADDAGVVAPFRGETDLFIYPGYKFKAVDALLTNFHLPRSSLLALVAAFAGVENVLAWYDAAVREVYRFYSYGDAMFIH
ncbi:MAG: tRNA preQ1(34) S-adenosylmethionine ribosyltransferase-isomerase QueA [candidate division Zixibacteria bacterium]|nr:tRNA preQ1(34) S-adenosylmethionine ribosyltransferase-isomerase QueA [candidate division Zixibacteria bacterium]